MPQSLTVSRPSSFSSSASGPSERLLFLDGLRGVAALLVMCFHFYGGLKDRGVIFSGGMVEELLAIGHYGVQIFFVLSGFVITYSLRDKQVSTDYCLLFWLKRSVRLDPPYWSVLALLGFLSVLGSWLFNKDIVTIPSFYEGFLNVIYAADFFDVPRLLPVSWTLAIEIQFYLIFILMMRVASSWNFLFRLSFVFLFFLSLAQHTVSSFFLSFSGSFLPYWYSFAIGASIAFLMLKKMDPKELALYFGATGAAAYFTGSGAIFAVLAIGALLWMAALKDKMKHWLSSSWIQYCGKISYSLYLIHWPVGMKCLDLAFRFFVTQESSGMLISAWLLLSVALTMGAASLFYQWIEKPSLEWSRKISVAVFRKTGHGLREVTKAI